MQKMLWLSNQLYSVPLGVEVAFIDILNYIIFFIFHFNCNVLEIKLCLLFVVVFLYLFFYICLIDIHYSF